MTLSVQQRKSLELYCTQMAGVLDSSGFEVTDGVVLKLPVRWTHDNFRENVFKAAMSAMYPHIQSTTHKEFDSEKLTEVYKQVDLIVSSRTGISLPFPSEESLRLAGWLK